MVFWFSAWDILKVFLTSQRRFQGSTQDLSFFNNRMYARKATPFFAAVTKPVSKYHNSYHNYCQNQHQRSASQQ